MSQSFVRTSTSIPANTSVTEKRTVITTSSGLSSGFGIAGADDDDVGYYRSSITPRTTSIMRTSLPTSPMRTTRSVEISSAFMPGLIAHGSANVAATGVISFKSNREKEKKDMQALNERFANYIEKVRFLEAQNKKLASELEQLRSHWGKETSKIKLMYETELTEARKLIDDTNKEKSRLQLRVGQLEEQLDDVMRQLDEAKKWRSQDRETINKLNQQVSELEGEVRMLRRSNDSLDTERQRDKATIHRLQEELEKLRIDLSNETIARLDAENKYQTLLEEMEFLKSVHEQELKELSALAYRDTTAENREFWKNELSQAIRDIQQEYDIKVDQIRGEMETFYNLKVQEFRTGATKQNMEVTHAREETKKLHKQLGDLRTRNSDLEARNAQLEKQYQDMLREIEQKDHEHVMEINSLKEEMNKLRAELEAMLIELQTLMDAKLSLELEIAAYRKLLEGEETRIPLRNSYRHSYTPYSTSASKTDSNGAPYSAPASSSKYSYSSSRGRDVTDAAGTSKVKATEMADSKPKASPEPLKIEADSKAAVSADVPLVKKSEKEETKINEKQSVAGKSLTPVKQEQESFRKTEMSQKLFQEKGETVKDETVKDEKTEIGDEDQWQKNIEDEIMMQTVMDSQQACKSMEEEIIYQNTELVMMEPEYQQRDEEVIEEQVISSVIEGVNEDGVVLEENEDQTDNLQMEIEEETVHVTEVCAQHREPLLELSAQDVEDALCEYLLKEIEGVVIIGESSHSKAEIEEPVEEGSEEVDVITRRMGSDISVKDVDEIGQGTLTVKESQREDTAEAPQLPHTPSPSPTEQFAQVSEETILDEAVKNFTEQTSPQTISREKVFAEEKTLESETKVDVVRDLSPMKEDIQEVPQATESTFQVVAVEKKDKDDTISAEEETEIKSEVISVEKEDKDQTVSAEEETETKSEVISVEKEDKDQTVSAEEEKETKSKVVAVEMEDKDETISAEEETETKSKVIAVEKEDKDQTVSAEEEKETKSKVVAAEKVDKDETISVEEETETTTKVSSTEKLDKKESISAKEATEPTSSASYKENKDQSEITFAKEATETSPKDLPVEKGDQDQTISAEEVTEKSPKVSSTEKEHQEEQTTETLKMVSAEKKDQGDTISVEIPTETTAKLPAIEKEDKNEIISAEEPKETAPKVVAIEKEDKKEIISAEEPKETAPKVLVAEKEDKKETISAEEETETTPKVLVAEKEDKKEIISAEEPTETTPKVIVAEKEDKKETISVEEPTETTPKVLVAEKEDQEEIVSALKEDQDVIVSAEQATETTSKVYSTEKEDKKETISAEEETETTPKVLVAEKEDKKEIISVEEPTEATPKVLVAEKEDQDVIVSALKEDQDVIVSAEQATETTSKVYSTEKEDKKKTISAEEETETTPKVPSTKNEDQEIISAEEPTETTSKVPSTKKEDQKEFISAEEKAVSLEEKVSVDKETVFVEKKVHDVSESESGPDHETRHEDQEEVSTTQQEEDVVEKEIVEQIAKSVEDSQKLPHESAEEDSHAAEISDLSKEGEVIKGTTGSSLEKLDSPTEKHMEDGDAISAFAKDSLLPTSADEELKSLSKSIVEETVEEAFVKEIAMKAEEVSAEKDESVMKENIFLDNDEEEETFITETYFVSEDGTITEQETGDVTSSLELDTSSDLGSAVETAYRVTKSGSLIEEFRETHVETTSSQIGSRKESEDSETLGEHEKVGKGNEKTEVTSTKVSIEVKEVEILGKITTTRGAEDEESKDDDADVISEVEDDAPKVNDTSKDDKERREEIVTKEVTTGEGKIQTSVLSENESQEKIMLEKKGVSLEMRGEDLNNQVELKMPEKEISEDQRDIQSESLTVVEATKQDKEITSESVTKVPSIKEDKDISRESSTLVMTPAKGKDIKTHGEIIQTETETEEIVKEVEKDNDLEVKSVEIGDKEELEVFRSEAESLVESTMEEDLKSGTERVSDTDDVNRRDSVDKSEDKESVKSNELIMKEENTDDQESDRQQETSFIQESPQAEKISDATGKGKVKEELISSSGIRADQTYIQEDGESPPEEEVVVELTKILTTDQVVKDSSSESLFEAKVSREAEESKSSKHTDVEKHLIAPTGESTGSQVTEKGIHKSGESVSIKQTFSEHQESLSTKQAGELEISPQVLGHLSGETALVPSDVSIVKTHSSQKEIVHTTSESHTTRVQHMESKVVTSVSSTKETKLTGSSPGTDAHSFHVTSFVSKDDFQGQQKDESGPSKKIIEEREHINKVSEEHTEDGNVVKVERKVHEHSQVVVESSYTQGAKDEPLSLGPHEDSALTSHTSTTTSENEKTVTVKETKVSLARSPSAEEDVIISKTFSLSESSAKFLSESGFIKDGLDGGGIEVHDSILEESTDIEIEDDDKEIEKPKEVQDVALKKVHSTIQQDSSHTDDKPEEFFDGENKDELCSEQHPEKSQDVIPKSQSTDREDTSPTEKKPEVITRSHSGSSTGDQEASKKHVEHNQTALETSGKEQHVEDTQLEEDTMLKEYTSVIEKTDSGRLPVTGQEQVEIHCDITVTDVSDEELARSRHDGDVKQDTKRSTAYSTHIEINVEEQLDDDGGDLDDTAEVKDIDDEIEEEILLVNGVKEDLLEASSPEISTFDQARADISIATPLPGDEKGIHDDTDDDVLNDAEMANGGEGDDAVTAEAGPGADEGSPTDTDTVSLHDVSASTEAHSLGKDVSESTQKTPDDDTSVQEGSISTRDVLSNYEPPTADTVDTHKEIYDGHTERFESHQVTTTVEVTRHVMVDSTKSVPQERVQNGNEHESENVKSRSTELSFQLKSEVVSETTKVTPEQVKEAAGSSGEVAPVDLNGDTTSGNIAVVSSEASTGSKQT